MVHIVEFVIIFYHILKGEIKRSLTRKRAVLFKYKCTKFDSLLFAGEIHKVHENKIRSSAFLFSNIKVNRTENGINLIAVDV
jgi:hypothetical protein